MLTLRHRKLVMKAPFLALLAVLFAPPLSAQVHSPPESAAHCAGCHASSADGLTPRLEGLSAFYILRRLSAFHSPASQAPHATHYMFSEASKVGPSQAHALADHYSRQPPAPAKPLPGLAARGRALYTKADQNGWSCQSCHGPGGEGLDAAPRLAGQRRPYLLRQLTSLMLATRVHDGMNNTLRHLTSEEAEAIAAYLGAD